MGKMTKLKTIEIIKNIMAIPEISNLPRNDFDDCVASVCSVICENNGVDMRDIESEILEIFSRGPVIPPAYFSMRSKLIN